MSAQQAVPDSDERSHLIGLDFGPIEILLEDQQKQLDVSATETDLVESTPPIL